MRRWIPLLAVLLVLQLAAATALALRHDTLAPVEPATPLVGVDLAGADHLAIDGPVPAANGAAVAKVEFEKRDGRWTLPGYFGAPADDTRVRDLLDRLTHTKRGLPIATTAEALARFKVADDRYERRIVARAGDKALATVYLGASPGLRKADARTAADRAVYTVELATYELPTEAARWFDQGLLDREAAKLAAIEVSAPGRTALTLTHAKGTDGREGSWTAAPLAAGKRVDNNGAISLSNVIGSLKVDEILGTEPKPEWQQDAPVLTVQLKDEAGKAVGWTLSKAKTGDFYVLKSSALPWYFQLKAWNAQPLVDAAAEDKLVLAADAPAAPKAAGLAAPRAAALKHEPAPVAQAADAAHGSTRK